MADREPSFVIASAAKQSTGVYAALECFATLAMTRRVRAVSLRVALVAAATTLVGFAPLTDSPTLADCRNGLCAMRMTAPQLLATTERIILARRFDDARPLLAALAQAPELAMETHFLTGYVAAETGDLPGAARAFRAVLRDRPDMTRARLELARVLMMQGKDAAADHHFRLAEQDADLAPEIERTIRDARGLIRSRRNWSFNIDFGIAPDTNINGATDARTIDFDFGTGPKTLTLNPDARRRSGIGQTLGANGSVRLRLKDGLAVRVDGNADIVNYRGTDADDISALIAAGPELTLPKGGRIAAQLVGFSHWYGGKVAQQGVGGRLSYQQDIGRSQRVGAQIDIRQVRSDFSNAYDGTSYAGYVSYERVIHRSMIASATLFARRDDLRSATYSNKEFGGNIGIGGELPLGLNAGLSAGISRALFDAPLAANPVRRDWRFNARAYLGARSIRVLGFSPSVTYSFNRIDTTMPLYASERHRFIFSLARYF
jgi:hypothetical protein